MAVEFRRKAQAKREAAKKQFMTVENFLGVTVRSPETVMALPLTPMESRMFAVLVANELVTKEAMYVALYPNFDTAPGVKILDVAMSRIRKKVGPYGIVIDTVLRRGWRLDPASRAQLNEVCGMRAWK